jgi:hypothetical protein
MPMTEWTYISDQRKYNQKIYNMGKPDMLMASMSGKSA